MDPNETLRLLCSAAAAGMDHEMMEYAEALRGWLFLGGFAPANPYVTEA